MNRDIKFRGKQIYNNEWVCGFLNISHFGECLIAEPPFIKHLISNASAEVHKESVGQFTGLVDKNGKEIYEGDIISVKHPFMGREHVGTVIFEEYMFNIEGFGMSHFDYPGIAFSEGTRYMEVIGNIHENKELLK